MRVSARLHATAAPEAIPPELMEQLDQNIRDYFGQNPEFRHEEEFLSKSETEVIPWFPQNPELPEYSAGLAAPFDRLETDRVLGQLTGALLGKDWSPLYSMVMYSRKGTVGQAWHRVLPITGAFRFSTNYRACPPGTGPDINDVCVYRNMRYRFSTNSVVEERPAPTG